MNQPFRQSAIVVAAFFGAVILSLVPITPAQSFIFHGGGAVSAGTLITTFTIANTSGSTISAGAITQDFQIPFESCTQAVLDGGVCVANGCAGASVVMSVSGSGDNIAYSESTNPICWKDGSLKIATFLSRIPDSIPSGGLVGNIYTGGTQPTSAQSSRSLCDTSAGGFDFNQKFTGLDNVSGSYTADLNTAIGTCGSPSNVVYHDLTGPVGDEWLVAVPFSNGSNQGQLYDYDYVQSLQDGSSNLYGMRILASLTAPHYNASCAASTCPPNFFSFSALGDYNGASEEINLWNTYSPFNFNWGGSGNSFSATIPSGIQTGLIFRLTNGVSSLPETATYPAGISGTTLTVGGSVTGAIKVGDLVTGAGVTSGTTIVSGSGTAWVVSASQSVSGGTTLTDYMNPGFSYFAYNTSGGGSTYSSTAFGVGFDSAAVTQELSLITPIGSSCSPCGSVTPYPYISQFGRMYDAQSNGRMNYWQGAGSSSSDQPIQIKIPNTYWRKTRLILPWNFSDITVTDLSDITYFPMTHGEMFPNNENTGGRPDIGPFTAWTAAYFYLMGAQEEQNVRANGLIGGQLPFNFRDVNTGLVPVVNNGSYAGMPTLSATGFRWTCGGTGTGDIGFTEPVNSNVLVAGWFECSMSHMPDFAMGAWLITGEPEYRDEVEEYANNAIYNLGRSLTTSVVSKSEQTIAGGNTGRNVSVNGTTYYGSLVSGGNVLRDVAWSWRALSGAVMASVADPSCPYCHQYYDDMTTGSENALTAYINMFNSTTCGSPCWVTANGAFYESTSVDGGAAWSGGQGYYLNALALSVNWTEDGSALTNFINLLNSWWPHVNSTWGTSYIGYYVNGMVRGPNGSSTAPYILSDGDMAFGGGPNFTWTSGNPVFTFVTGTPLNANYSPSAGDVLVFNEQAPGALPPTNFSGETPYYLCPDGANWELSNSSSSCSAGNIITPGNNSGGNYGSANFYSPNWGYNPITRPSATNQRLSAADAGDSYYVIVLSGLLTAQALGLTADQTTINDLTSFIQAQPGYPSFFETVQNGGESFPTYFTQGSYLTANDHTGLDEGYIPANDNWHEKMLMAGHP